MHNVEELWGQPSDQTRVLPAYRWLRPRPRPGRIRYAHDEAVPRETVPRPTAPRAEPHCAMSRGTSSSHAASGHYGTFHDDGHPGTGELGVPWSARFPVYPAYSAYPVAGTRNDLWVLVCGGIATVAAFAAAFIASGGLASHAATSVNTVPIAVTRACPTPVP
jgi:hypothetical protein